MRPSRGACAAFVAAFALAGIQPAALGDLGPSDESARQPSVGGRQERAGEDGRTASTRQESPFDSLDPVDPASRAAVDRALAWLAARQAEEPDGSYPPVGAKDPAPLAVTALATLAFLSNGNLPGRGPYGEEVRAGVDYLLDHVDRSADATRRGYIEDSRDTLSRMHGHGFATVALAEAYSLSPRSPRGARMRESIELAIARIQVSQGLEGAWYYQPISGIQHEGSVTIALVQALRAAKNAGFHVQPEVIARAVDYVKRSQMEDGSFRYALGSGDTSVALTAAAISTLNATGSYSGAPITQGYDYIERELAKRVEDDDGLGSGPSFPYYERLYLAQAYWQHQDRKVFQRWSALERDTLLAQQRPDGSWGGSEYGDCYATAVNVLVLTLPDGLLPVFQR